MKKLRPAPRPAPGPFRLDRPRLRRYALLMRFDRPVGTLLLLWPTLWALWLAAEGLPHLGVLLVFVAGVVLMRAAGCIINDYADRWLDPNVERTRSRPLATGEVSLREALALFGALMLVALLLVLTMNRLTVLLAFVGAALAVAYPYMKRHTYFPQVVLGAAFGWAIPMAFAAQTGSVPQLGWLLFLVHVLWSTAYDTLYAMVDRDDDLRMGAKSTAILFGDLDHPIIGLLQGCFLVGMLLVGQQAELGWPYLLALAVAAAMIARQMWLTRTRSREACFAAFLDNARVGAVIFVGIVVAYALA